MTFYEIINSNNWLSVQLTLENLFPEQSEYWDEYKKAFDTLSTMKPKSKNITIDVHWVHDDYDHSDYVDVSGYYTNPSDRTDKYTNSLAIEYTPWAEWLGMPLDEKSLQSFNELEIIAYCLDEMTFAGFEQEEIQADIARVNKIADDYDKMTPEERKKNTYTWDEVEKRLGINIEDDENHDIEKDDIEENEVN